MAINCNASALPQVVACFESCIPDNLQLAVQNYLWCQIANTTKFGGGGGMSPGTPAPTGFNVNSNLAGTRLTAGWSGPAPAGVTGTEVWTSTDGVNYTLFATVTIPTFTSILGGGLGVGNFLWTKIRWTNGAGMFSNFTTPIEWSGQAMDWAARVLANGGSLSGIGLILAVNNMWCSLVNGGISSQILCLNPIAGPGDLIASSTPLIKGAGSDPWVNHNANNTFFDVNGFSPATSAALNTSFAATSFTSAANAGLSLYAFTAGSENNYDTGCFDGANAQCTLRVNATGNTVGCMFAAANQLTVACPGAGFYSMNRVSATDFRIFWGNSTNAMAQQGGTLAGANGALLAQLIYEGCLNNANAFALFTGHTHSFWAVHNGLTLAQATTLFNAVQAMRVAIGGGFV